MTATLTSRERLLRTIHFEPTDRVPLLLRFWSMGAEQDQIPFNWRDDVERVENTLALGLDDTLTLQPPLGYVEEYVPEALERISSRVERLPPAGGSAEPLLKKVYETPAGPLQTVVRLADDWIDRADIALFDDLNISHLHEPLIKTADDLPRLRRLLGTPSAAQVEHFRERARTLRMQADRLGVVLDGGWTALGDTVVWLCGMQRILYGQMDEPEFLEQVLQVIADWELERVRLLLEEDVDVIVHMAWYESADFWTPANYRRLLQPLIQREIDLVHQAGKLYRYIITKSWKPHVNSFLEMGIDCLTGVDPVQDRIDLTAIKQTIGRNICLMGGMNSAVMLAHWSDEQIRAAVDQALAVLAPGGGFIGYPVDAVFDIQPWEKVEVLIKRWRELNP
jgi:hypothetical protein